jgi:Tc toxin complex TcA C-terminal TcB-binding domain
MTISRLAFHGSYDKLALTRNFNRRPNVVGITPVSVHYTKIVKDRKLNYRFSPHFHPYVTRLVSRLIEQSVPGLQAADTEYQTAADGSWATFGPTYPDTTRRGKFIPILFEDFFAGMYHPNPGNIADLIGDPVPAKELDFSSSGAYSVYNWELFFHIPIIVAVHLSKNGHFQEAQNWFHYVFDPTDDSNGPTPERFWKVKPFQTTHIQLIQDILVNLSSDDDPQLRTDTINCINAWKANPFRPHLIARYRQSAYMFKTVFAYLDNLIAWGDDDFRKDLPEDVDAALLKYVLAANILGVRPQEVPSKGTVKAQTYAALRSSLDPLGNALRPLENEILFNNAPAPADAGDDFRFQSIANLGNTLYFSVPRNENLLQYWDTVADRLFKIRNSLNFQGIFRQLPLFAPPIDPGLLAKAIASGLDINAAISGLNVSTPLIRFQMLLQKATEICQEVKSLGSNLLSAMEKQDGEALGVLRAHHETMILQLTESVRYSQWQDAIKSKEGLLVNLQNSVQKYTYYEKQLGKMDSEIKLPELTDLDNDGLINLKFLAKEPGVGLRDLPIDIAQSLNQSGGKIISSFEAEELDKLSTARELQDAVQGLRLGGKVISILPQFGIKFHFWGLGGDAGFGGQQLSKLAEFAADVASAIADHKSYEAGNAAKIGTYSRRQLEWAFQSNTIAGEITQMYKQIRGAQIREAITEKEWHNHQQQIKNSQDIESFLSDEKTGKKTNQAFYTWMKREVQGLYNQSFQFAWDVARKSERALQLELGDNSVSFIGSGYTSGKEGLLAGEKLLFDLKQMDLAYHELNKREYEMTSHISLMQINPAALLQLRTTGRCALTIPEEWFDMEGPGHYMRRIKSVAVSIPCITGPYASVNCTLTLTKSIIRTKAILSDGSYSSTGDTDDRFNIQFGSTQSVVTSSAQNDSGLFETNLHDERVLPFEYSGALSSWQLSLPGKNNGLRQFNYDSISDVIIHMRYTAREGGDLLAKGAMENLKAGIAASTVVGTVRLFSIRQEFPNDWEKFKSTTRPDNNSFVGLSLTLRPEHYPFWSRGSVVNTKEMKLFARSSKTPITVRATADDSAHQDQLNTDKTFSDLKTGKLTNVTVPAPIGSFSLFLDDNTMDDLWITLLWGS